MPPELRNIADLAKHTVKSLLAGRGREASAGVRVVAWRLREAFDGLSGSRDATCAFCGWSGRRFKTLLAGRYVRRGAVCPRCLSLERHRDFIVLFRRLRPLFGERIRILDIAPTRAFAEACRAAPDVEYVSVDRISGLAMALMDVQRLAVRGEAFDIVVCYHVLDYVPDDRAAMREIGRVLRANGVGILQERVDAERPTAEWTAPKPEALDRIRGYGYDFPDRLRQAGLDVHVGPAGTFLVFKEGANALADAAAIAVGR